MPTDPSVQTPEQREAELRAAGWTQRWYPGWCALGWVAPDGRPFDVDAETAYIVMRAERGEQ
jgi:hypothetical protein